MVIWGILVYGIGFTTLPSFNPFSDRQHGRHFSHHGRLTCSPVSLKTYFGWKNHWQKAWQMDDFSPKAQHNGGVELGMGGFTANIPISNPIIFVGEFSWYSHDNPMIIPWCSHNNLIFPWYSHDIPMICWWLVGFVSHFSHRFLGANCSSQRT